MTETLIWDPFERLLWGLAISVLIVNAIFYYKQGKKKEEELGKLIFKGTAGIFIGLIFNRFFFYLSEFLVPGVYLNYVFLGDYSSVDLLYELILRLSWISYAFGFLLYFIFVEKAVLKSRLIFSALLGIVLAAIAITPFETARTLNTVAFGLSGMITFLISFKLIQMSRIEYKGLASIHLLGGLFGGAGMVLSYMNVKELNTAPLIIAPVIYAIGIIIYSLPSYIEFKNLKQILKLWVIASITLVLCIVAAVTSIFMYEFPLFIGIAVIVITIGGCVIFYMIIRNIIKYMQFPEEEAELPDLLKMFTKPKKVTEEEVSVSKEKKICLVCKGSIMRMNYMCPVCFTFYCPKCYQALTKLENACWSCDEAMDTSKPVKLPVPAKVEGKGKGKKGELKVVK
jgi:hypothetical protein